MAIMWSVGAIRRRARGDIQKVARNLEGGAVLFDLDGTLIDTAADLAAAMNFALAAEGLAGQPVETVRHLVGHGARRMLEQGYLLSTGEPLDAERLEAALRRFLAFYSQNIAIHSTPFDGVLELILELRACGAKIAICTNKREHLARCLINALAIADLFDSVVGGDSAAHPKPDRAPVDLCLEMTGVGRAAFIGDSDTDILAAAAASVPCFIATFGYGPLKLREKARFCFENYDELGAPLKDALSD